VKSTRGIAADHVGIVVCPKSEGQLWKEIIHCCLIAYKNESQIIFSRTQAPGNLTCALFYIYQISKTLQW